MLRGGAASRPFGSPRLPERCSLDRHDLVADAGATPPQLSFEAGVRPGRIAVAGALWLACCPFPSDAVSQAAPFKVMLAGDSIVEGCDLRVPGHTGGLGDAARRALRSQGIRAGGGGYLPVHDALPATRELPRSYWPVEYDGDWSFDGTFGSAPSPFAPDGFSSSSSAADSVLSATLRADRVGLLYGIAPDGGQFTAALGDRAERLNARAAAPRTGVRWLPAPGAVDRLRISAIAGGVARLAGLIVRRDGDEVEIDQLGRSGAQALDGLSAPNRQALAALDPDLTILMFGTNEEGMALAGDVEQAADRLARGLALRARLARRSGGRPRSLQGRLSRVAARAARAGGCSFRPVLSRLWRTGDESIRRGLTSDGIHPTAAGYELMGGPLARLIAERMHRSRPR
jgi:lysophospholipase L1-like esterase